MNPVQATPEVLAAAMAHYADHCATCHGNDGRGLTLIRRGLYPKPPDMSQYTTQQAWSPLFCLQDCCRPMAIPSWEP
jgi:mono/diheme cytochrome c family protein